MSEGKISVAAISSYSQIEKQDFNLANILKWTEKLSKKGADFILFPELSLSGYTRDGESLVKIMQEVFANFSKLLEASKAFPAALSVGHPLEESVTDNGEERKIFYIAQSIIFQGRVLHTHRKTQLSPGERLVYREGDLLMPETVSGTQPLSCTNVSGKPFKKMSLTPGNVSGTVTFRGVTLANQICFETHFPEITAFLESQGAEVMVMPFASPGEKPSARVKRLKKFLPARAYDNSVFLLSCNNVALNKRVKSPAISMIINPRGDIVQLSKGWRENYVMSEIDMETISELKAKRMSYFRKFAQKNIFSFI